MINNDQKERYNELIKARNAIYKNSLKQKKIMHLISIALGLVIGIIIVMVSFKEDNTGGMDIDTLMQYFYGGLLIFVISIIPHIILHEAGHLVFGLLTGYKFLSFRIFSILFYKKDGHLQTRKFSMKGTGGQCLMYPPKRREDGSFPFVLYNLGGGISNLVFSVPFIFLAILTDNVMIQTFYIAFLVCGLLIAATNIIPMNMGVQNDGMNLKSMLKSKNLQEAFYLQLKINAELSDGKQITDYSLDEMTFPDEADASNMLAVVVRLYIYYQQLANHDFDAAVQTLSGMEEKSEQYLPIILNTLEAERLFFMVLQKSPVEEIASVYNRSRLVFAGAKTNISIQRVQYIYETFLTEEEKKDIVTLITKKKPKVWKEINREKLYQDFLKKAKKYPVAGMATMHVEIVEYLRNNYDRNRTTNN